MLKKLPILRLAYDYTMDSNHRVVCIAQGLLKSVNVNKCTFAGTHSIFCFWVADWFALMNDKMGGDLSKIVIVGKYLIEVWKAAVMDLSNVEFRWASDEITQMLMSIGH